jgi:hypothetical protein
MLKKEKKGVVTMAENMNGAVEKPRLCNCNLGWHMSYKTTDRSSTNVRNTRETSSQKTNKAIKDRK